MAGHGLVVRGSIGALVAGSLIVTGLTAAAPAPREANATTTQTFEVSPAAAAAKKKYRLVFRDEFNGRTLKSHWQNRPASASRPCTTTKRSMGKVRHGKLRISVKRDKSRPKSRACPKGWFFNTQLTTEAAEQFRYGKFKARIKFQREKGLHGSFFLFHPPGFYDTDRGGLPGRMGAEIDTVEYFGDKDVQREHGRTFRGAIQNSVYYPKRKSDGSIKWKKVGGRQDTRRITDGKKPSRGYHTYEVKWTPHKYVFKMDGRVTFTTKRGISHRPQFLFLSMLTSAWEIPDLKPRVLPATMKVDWVRVYQKR